MKIVRSWVWLRRKGFAFSPQPGFIQKVLSKLLPSYLAPIVAAARCFVSDLGMQRLQRIAGLAMIRDETVGSLKEL
ncbi:MAG: hypothetical protein WCL14_03285 [Bacteroidota bacterium]